MPETIERTPLQIALEQACQFAIAHGVEAPITPEDFGIQRSDAGFTNATYVDADHAITVLVDRYGHAKFAVAELDWVHNESDEDRDECAYCDIENTEQYRGVPLTDVYLPGDAPKAVADA